MTKLTPEQIKDAADRAEARSRGVTAGEFVDASISEGELKAEIAKLAALPIGVYESSRVEAAKRLKVRAHFLDSMVETLRDKDKPADNGFLPHWKTEAWPDPVDGAVLLDELRALFPRYVVLPPHADVVLALWTLHTWVFDCFDITPYLAITSPTRRCGKSLVLTMLHWLTARGKKNDSMSQATIYRSVEAEKPTLLLDECSWVKDLKDERQNILCGGFEIHGHAERCEGESANQQVRRYSTYCPKAFGIIGKLVATLMDRSVELPMQRKKKGDVVERLRRRDNAAFANMRRQCLRWANDSRARLRAITPAVLQELNDRAFDIWEPLLSIAECAGGDWPELARKAAIAVSGDEADVEEIGVELLRDIKAAFDSTAHTAMTTKRLIGILCADEERPWATYGNRESGLTATQLGGLLRKFHIISETATAEQTGEPKDAKGYRRVRFAEAFERYLTPTKTVAKAAAPLSGVSETSLRHNADGIGTSDGFSKRHQTESDGCEKCEKPAPNGQSDGVTPEDPPQGRAAASDQENDFPAICEHCGGASTADAPVQPCAVDGEEHFLHSDCQADWLGATPPKADDLSIPDFLRRA